MNNKEYLMKRMVAFCDNKVGRANKSKPNFTIDDLISKIGENPKCALTGRELNYEDKQSYQFDHMIPLSKNGDNTLSNLQILSTDINRAKSDKTNDEFINLCIEVLQYNNFTVTKNEEKP